MSEDKKRKKLKENIYTISFMFVITFVFISVLAFINLSTRDITAQNQKLALQKAVLIAGDIADFNSENIGDIYKSNVQELKDYPGIFKLINNNYVFINNGPGLWGDIKAVIGFKEDMKTVTGIEFIKQSETPGLGARIDEEWFKKQIKGVKTPLLKIIPEGENNEEQTIQGITGATKTSVAVKDIINKAVKISKEKIISAETKNAE